MLGVWIDDLRGLILINWETLEKVCSDMMLLCEVGPEKIL